MSDATQAGASAPQEQHGKFVLLVKSIPTGIHKTLIVVSWVMPVVILAVGAGFFTSLRAGVTWPWKAPEAVWLGLFVQLVLAFGFLYWQNYYVTHRNTGVAQLQADAVGTILLALVLTLLAGMFMYAGSFPWYYIIPLLTSIWDALQTAFLGINNAAEKPYVPSKGST